VQGVKEEFDWAGYLLEGEDIAPRHYIDSPVSCDLLVLIVIEQPQSLHRLLSTVTLHFSLEFFGSVFCFSGSSSHNSVHNTWSSL